MRIKNLPMFLFMLLALASCSSTRSDLIDVLNTGAHNHGTRLGK